MSAILKKWLLYMDFTASWLADTSIEDEIQTILHTYANTHSEIWYNAKITQKYYNQARNSLYKTLEINDDFCILPIWTWATWAIKKFQEIIWIYISPSTKQRYNINPKNLPLVIIWPFEHHSNEISFREALCDVIRIPLNKDGVIDLNFLENTLDKNKNKEIIWSFSAVSNVSWIKNPIKDISKLIKKYNGTMCIDAAASSPYFNKDCSLYDAMFLSPHKLLWWPGSCGVLVIKKDLCNKINTPTFAWWGTVDYVSKVNQIYSKNIEQREDAWTPWILQFIRASLAYELRNKIWLNYIEQKEKELQKYFYNKIKDIKNIKLYCSPKHDKIAIFSFNIKWISPYFLTQELSDKYWIQTRAGCSCAWPYWHDLLWLDDSKIDLKNKPWWLRVWLHYTHTKKDIDYFIKSLNEILQ